MRKLLFTLLFLAVGIVWTMLFTKPTFAADICQGYQTDSNGRVTDNTVMTGICIYATSDSPGVTTDYWTAFKDQGTFSDKSSTCATLVPKTGRTGTYMDITDSAHNCPWFSAVFRCCAPKNQPPSIAPIPPCASFSGAKGQSQCTSVNTAFGKLPTDAGGLISKLFGIVLSIAGGVALILIIAAGYQLMASGGNPEKVKEARERLTSAIVGLIFIIFAFVIFQTIAVTILGLPGINK